MNTPRIDDIVGRLTARAPDWHRLGPPERAALLRQCIGGVASVAGDWAALGCRAKGIDPSSSLAGEEWITGPMITIRGFRLMAETLESLSGPETVTVKAGPGGRAVAAVFPASVFDRLLYRGIEGELWLQPGAPSTRAEVYRGRTSSPDTGVALVLGAGNVSSIGPLDALTMLVMANQVTLLKLNPVNRYLRPVFEEAFAPLIDAGYLALFDGDAGVGEALCHHPAVSRIHLTGARQTYDAIMWGRGADEQRERRAAGTPKLAKPFTAELGCVTPILAVPGPWSEGDLQFQARHVAATVTHNASFNCVAGKVLVVARDWPQREAFLEAVEGALARTPARVAYYPGAHERYAAFLQQYPQARVIGPTGDGAVPWTLIPDVQPVAGEYALRHEAFCGVLAVVSVDGHDAPSFLERAVPFVNESVEGTLSATVLVHPATERAYANVIEQALADLRYGSIGVNLWSGLVFAIGTTSWGAFPGHTPADVGSGIGLVHNTFLFDHAERSIVRGPFRMWPTPVWFPDHRTLLEVGRRMTAFEAAPSFGKLPGILAAAVRA